MRVNWTVWHGSVIGHLLILAWLLLHMTPMGAPVVPPAPAIHWVHMATPKSLPHHGRLAHHQRVRHKHVRRHTPVAHHQLKRQAVLPTKRVHHHKKRPHHHPKIAKHTTVATTRHRSTNSPSLAALAQQEQHRVQTEMVTRSKLLTHLGARIARHIGRFWRVPPALISGVKVTLQLTLDAKGHVLKAKVLHSSGVAALDRSALLAIQHAQPLPVPKNKLLFNVFKNLTVVVRPTLQG